MCDCQEPRQNDDLISRRRFLGMAASAGGASLLSTRALGEPKPRLGMPWEAPRSRVAVVRSRNVLAGTEIRRPLLAEMLSAALTTAVPQAGGADDVWRSLLKPDDIIGIKLNRSGQEHLGTTSAFTGVLIESLIKAGWSPKQIVCIEAPPGLTASYGTCPPRLDYDAKPTDFGSGADQFAAVLHQITALINVPYLKTHNLAGMTCALKNLSHGLVKHPGRYHGNGCSPYIADIVASEAIRSRLRLSLVDALRVVFQGGPTPSPENVSPEGIIVASLDPVATDAVGLTLLNDVRRRQRLPRIARHPEDLPYLSVAQQRELGMASTHVIEAIRLEE